eukprot:TRINITY_DN3038_c0_g2_i4.p1 TRINITY_DN3038_c0_g2~~TRINITY_DN3038_c0_g2_i4.p1  ORF type:complete len:182 (-),score=7.08 TRINITY_DN3038_c0_g2_i4:177-722(-)
MMIMKVCPYSSLQETGRGGCQATGSPAARDSVVEHNDNDDDDECDFDDDNDDEGIKDDDADDDYYADNHHDCFVLLLESSGNRSRRVSGQRHAGRHDADSAVDVDCGGGAAAAAKTMTVVMMSDDDDVGCDAHDDSMNNHMHDTDGVSFWCSLVECQCVTLVLRKPVEAGARPPARRPARR